MALSLTVLFIVMVTFVWSDTWCHADREYVITQTNYGLLRGKTKDLGGKKIVSFLGVPYAKPPTGIRRFKRPEIPDSWAGITDALTLGPKCPQIDVLDPNDSTPMNEDCLNLNIYTPAAITNETLVDLPAATINAKPTMLPLKLLPVMVWIHGGGFMFGSGSKYNGSALAGKDVVVVTVNYRLDALGFLSTEDSEIPGNVGLLDQVMALHWVQANIEFFGGDPSSVTVFGESSGGACVSLHVLSPLAKGLFQRAVVESGSSLAHWSIAYPTGKIHPRSAAYSLASMLNCTAVSSNEILACLQSVDVFELVNVSAEFRKSSKLDVLFPPRVESVFGFLPDYPLSLLLSGKFNHVDTIRGYNSDEGWYFLDTTSTQMSPEGFRESIHNLMTSFRVFDSDSIVNQYQDAYIRNVTNPELIFRRALTAVSDFVFIVPIVLETMLEQSLSRDRKHYLYDFQYKRSASKTPPFVGAVHGEEQAFIFRSFDEYNFWPAGEGVTENDMAVSDQMMAMWSNFAKYGDPSTNLTSSNVTWTPFLLDQQNCLTINNSTTLGDHGRQQAVRLFSRFLNFLTNDHSSTVIG